jgi:hypothetical protein
MLGQEKSNHTGRTYRVSRRKFLKDAGAAALGLAALTAIFGAITSYTKINASESAAPVTTNPLTTGQTSDNSSTLPWPYIKIDPKAAAERAYEAYYNGGCMYGAFEGIIGELRDNIGFPYDTFPAAVTKYGSAGVHGWGTLCGALNGVAEAIFLMRDTTIGGQIIDEVYAWYATSELPDYKPNSPKFDDIARSVSDSPLCHVSVTKWCNHAGYKTTTPERAERCAWLTASTVKYTVELLNKEFENKFEPTFAIPSSVSDCLSCHGKGGEIENVHISKQVDCNECHAASIVTYPEDFNIPIDFNSICTYGRVVHPPTP